MSALPQYGTVNLDYMMSWLSLTDDGPMWALNLMKYHPIARYADGRETTITGSEADEIYKPDEPLARLGARILFISEVTAHIIGDDLVWDRVAIAQYPVRSALLTMQSDPQFQELHVHKEAAMDFTIVTATFPLADVAPPANPLSAVDTGQLVLLDLVADASVPELGAEVGATPIGRFSSEDVVIGDDRKWAEARWDLISRDAAAELAGRDKVHATDRYALILDPRLDLISQSLIEDAAGTYPAKM